jgi:hypothetical protein
MNNLPPGAANDPLAPWRNGPPVEEEFSFTAELYDKTGEPVGTGNISGLYKIVCEEVIVTYYDVTYKDVSSYDDDDVKEAIKNELGHIGRVYFET